MDGRISNAVDAVTQIPAKVQDAASKGDAYNAAYDTMSGVLLVEGAAGLAKAGVGVLTDVNAAAKAASVEAKAVGGEG